jgi:hypothetical protein
LNWLTRRMSLVEQELLTLPEHLSLPPAFSEVRVTRSLALCVCFVDRCLSLCTFKKQDYINIHHMQTRDYCILDPT